MFWDQGYEGASVEDLTTAMHITTQSLYAAFGSKELLYKHALAWYQQEVGDLARRALAEEPDVTKAVELAIRELARLFTRSEQPRGCMRSTALVGCGPQHATLAAHTALLRSETAQAIKSRLDKAKRDGQLARKCVTPALAGFLNALIIGMSVAAKDGATMSDLLPYADMAGAWIDGYRSSRPGPIQKST